MIVNLKSLIKDLVASELNVAHLAVSGDGVNNEGSKVYFRVESVEDIDSQVKKAIAKEYNGNFLNDSDWILIFGNVADMFERDEEDDEEDEEEEKAAVDDSESGEMKIKIAKCLRRSFKLREDEKVELFDLPFPWEGGQTLKLFFAKLSYK